METTGHLLLSAIQTGRPPSDEATRRDFGFVKCKDAQQEGLLLEFYEYCVGDVGVYDHSNACILSKWQKEGMLMEGLKIVAEDLGPGDLPMADIIQNLDLDVLWNSSCEVKSGEDDTSEEDSLIDLSEPRTEAALRPGVDTEPETGREDDEETKLGYEDDEGTVRANTSPDREKTYQFGRACLRTVRARQAFAVAVAVRERARKEVEKTEKELVAAEQEETSLRRELLK